MAYLIVSLLWLIIENPLPFFSIPTKMYDDNFVIYNGFLSSVSIS